eukprot:m.70331 g.70331  ORF g.70331 m.70331 type:complete len:68 (-) comp20068_c0_seq1:221-424(-)
MSTATGPFVTLTASEAVLKAHKPSKTETYMGSAREDFKNNKTDKMSEKNEVEQQNKNSNSNNNNCDN